MYSSSPLLCGRLSRMACLLAVPCRVQIVVHLHADIVAFCAVVLYAYTVKCKADVVCDILTVLFTLLLPCSGWKCLPEL